MRQKNSLFFGEKVLDVQECLWYCVNIMGRKEIKTKQVEVDVDQKRFFENQLTHKAGISVGEAAAEVGVDRATFSQWKNGHIRPGTERLGKIAKVLRCDVLDLYKIMYPEIHREMMRCQKQSDKVR